VLTDPHSVTYNSVSKSLPRTSAFSNGATYRTADGEFEVKISRSRNKRDGRFLVQYELVRILPDPTPGDAFDAFRDIRNSFGVTYGFDPSTRAQASIDHPLLRSAVLAVVDSTFYGRLMAGES
jgi:hypothetical protein